MPKASWAPSEDTAKACCASSGESVRAAKVMLPKRPVLRANTPTRSKQRMTIKPCSKRDKTMA
jgi:hypothetical protein